MTHDDEEHVGPQWLPGSEVSRILADLLNGPRPRPVDPALRASLVAGLNPDEAEVVRGLLEIVETGGSNLDDLLAELDRMVKGNDPPPPA
jgi:hypothetical protein